MAVCWNPTISSMDNKYTWKSALLMDGYYVVIAIPYVGFGVIINIISKEDTSYHVTIGDIPQYTCPDFTKMSSGVLGEKMLQVSYKHFYYVFKFLCKLDYENNKFIHAPTHTYNEVMHLLELVGEVEHEQSWRSCLHNNVSKQQVSEHRWIYPNVSRLSIFPTHHNKIHQFIINVMVFHDNRLFFTNMAIIK